MAIRFPIFARLSAMPIQMKASLGFAALCLSLSFLAAAFSQAQLAGELLALAALYAIAFVALAIVLRWAESAKAQAESLRDRPG